MQSGLFWLCYMNPTDLRLIPDQPVQSPTEGETDIDQLTDDRVVCLHRAASVASPQRVYERHVSSENDPNDPQKISSVEKKVPSKDDAGMFPRTVKLFKKKHNKRSRN